MQTRSADEPITTFMSCLNLVIDGSFNNIYLFFDYIYIMSTITIYENPLLFKDLSVGNKIQ